MWNFLLLGFIFLHGVWGTESAADAAPRIIRVCCTNPYVIHHSAPVCFSFVATNQSGKVSRAKIEFTKGCAEHVLVYQDPLKDIHC